MEKGEKKNNPTKDEQDRIKNIYKGKIIELVEKIENPEILMKIYTVVKTHYEILKEKEQED